MRRYLGRLHRLGLQLPFWVLKARDDVVEGVQARAV